MRLLLSDAINIHEFYQNIFLVLNLMNYSLGEIL